MKLKNILKKLVVSTMLLGALGSTGIFENSQIETSVQAATKKKKNQLKKPRRPLKRLSKSYQLRAKLVLKLRQRKLLKLMVIKRLKRSLKRKLIFLMVQSI